MLKITLHDSSSELRFRLEGKLSGPWVGELRQCWQTARSALRNRKTVLDLADLEFADAEGQSLLEEMHGQGVTMVAMSVFMKAILDQVCTTRRCATVEEPTPDVVASPTAAGPDSGTV